ncbi:translation elongation factor Ts [Wolbachia endosymbiont of Chironomus riparius]|uniref:translation elongation factor Ts n=1 Tax=Wolbachia endosymbiont of Chironomus riparius TaxID=2883238 RepID=UPI00209CDFCF|nr:translation elongation factor Ts [Wolbachia endosymbiont of Chironomus riparius]
MTININDIKLLRDRTGAGISDCKKALEECNGNIERASDKLRVIGLAKAGRKSDRVVSEGLIAMHLSENYGVLIELNCETDFVAKNERFMGLALKLASLACKERFTKIDELQNAKYEETSTVNEVILNESSVLGEKLQLSKFDYATATNGIIAGYVHGSTSSTGKIGALVVLESHGDKIKLQEIGKQVAMHIVAMKPEALSIDDLGQDKLNNKRSLILEEVKNLNKPEEVTKKIIDGRMAKYYEEVVLLEQKFIKDDKLSVCDFLKSSLNVPVELSSYRLLALSNDN